MSISRIINVILCKLSFAMLCIPVGIFKLSEALCVSVFAILVSFGGSYVKALRVRMCMRKKAVQLNLNLTKPDFTNKFGFPAQPIPKNVFLDFTKFPI